MMRLVRIMYYIPLEKLNGEIKFCYIFRSKGELLMKNNSEKSLDIFVEFMRYFNILAVKE